MPSQSPGPKKPSPERKFVQQFVNALIRWMPLGGSGWLFVSYLLQQEWLLTLVTFPVTAVTAVWAAYSQQFIEQLQEIYGQRGKADANKLVAWMDSINEALKWQFSGFEAKYLECQRLDCQEEDPEGMKNEGLFTPLLREVFVSLRLSADCLIQPGFSWQEGLTEQAQVAQKIEEGELGKDHVVLIWDLLRQVKRFQPLRQMAVRAWGGYGKTTLLKHVTYAYSTREYKKYRAPKLTPFLLYLARCHGQLTKLDAPSLPELLANYHIPALPKGRSLELPPLWIDNLLNQGNALVMFDGFDEVPQGDRAQVSRWLSEQMRQYPDTAFIATSRPAAYEHDYTAKQPTASFWVDDFDQDQRRRFVEQWYLCQERYARAGRATADVKQKAAQKAVSLLAQIEARPELSAMAGNALLLNMMARFHRDNQGSDLPSRRIELYQDICELQLGRRPKAKGISLLLNSLSQRQDVLQHVALAMMQCCAMEDSEDFKQIDREGLLKRIEFAIVERDLDVPPADFLRQIVRVSELMVEKERNIYEFSHLSFQEFLAACEVVRLRQEELLYDKLHLDGWKPTILLYADMVNPTRLIRAALERQQTNLAYNVWRNTAKRSDLTNAEQKELERLKRNVQSSRYGQLEEYLKNGQWKKADKETYRLIVTAVDKEAGQVIDSKKMPGFPCEELLMLDNLWVKYSKGEFGFSVQKNIFVECEGRLDTFENLNRGGVTDIYYQEAVFLKFGDTISWRKNGKWTTPDMFLGEMPKGHLPLSFSYFYPTLQYTWMISELVLLFVRFETCYPRL